MKKTAAILMIFVIMLMAGVSQSSASTYFSHNKALDGIFQKMEKEFLQYKKVEVVPLKSLGAIITEENKDKVKPITRVTQKISDAQMKAAAQKLLNEIQVEIEILENLYGGLTAKDYKKIEDHLSLQLFLASKTSDYGWDTDGKNVALYLDVNDQIFWDFYSLGMEGKFAAMGKEKDQPYPADLQVKAKVTRYLNQSIQKGNKVSPEILAKLPDAIEALFKENDVSYIIASWVLSEIQDSIYNPEYESYDGSESLESILESFQASINVRGMDRADELLYENFDYPKDKPSDKNRRDITSMFLYEKLTDYFKTDFTSTITLGELARLYFENETYDDRFVIDSSAISQSSPDYIKLAFLYGMIDDESNLNKPLTRLEAARILVKGSIYEDWSEALMITDNNVIPIADQITVASALAHGMHTRNEKFDATGAYTKEEAIMDFMLFEFENVRGYNVVLSTYEPEKIIVGKNSINLLFNDKEEIKEYIEDNFYDTVLEDITKSQSYTRIDSGAVLIDLYTPENGIKFTVKNNAQYVDLEEGMYGPYLSYYIEPKILKSNESVDMNMQLDSINKKLNTKLDAVLAKIIKKDMTEEQKVKAIHDFVVNHITYDVNYMFQGALSLERIIETLDKGRGACGNYSLLFKFLCRRASIPCTYEQGDPNILNHAWNSVYVNGQWLFVDTTWDDKDDKKVYYSYYLKDRFAFMRDHTPYMGNPEVDLYGEVDNMKLKTQDELRVYLLRNFYWWDGFSLTFRMADKTMKPNINYLYFGYMEVNVQLTYDAKTDLYTVSAKSKK